MKKCYPLFLLFLLLLMATNALAVTYYVDSSNSNASDSNAGTMDSPWATIQKAADNVLAGDTVLVKPGEYDRTVITRSGTSEAPIVFKSSTRPIITYPNNGVNIPSGDAIAPNATYDGTNAYLNNPGDVATTKGFIVSGVTNVVIDGFEITEIPTSGGTSSQRAGIYFTAKSDNITFQYLYVHELAPTSANGDLFQYASGATCDYMNVTRCDMWRVEGKGITLNGDYCVASYNEISHNSRGNWLTGEDTGMDSDGMRFFGSFNVMEYNYIHDILEEEQVGDPHSDGFQTFTNNGETNTFNTINGNRVERVEQFLMCSDTSEVNGDSDNAHHLTLTNNVGLDIRGYGMIVKDCANTLIANNTMVDCLYGAFRLASNGGAAGGSINSQVLNNIFIDCPNFPEDSSSDGSVCTYNIYYPDFTFPYKTGWESNNLFGVDPHFTDLNNELFSLKSTSPAINAGYNTNAPSKDITGAARIGNVDIGAYEYVGESGPSTPPTIGSVLIAPSSGYAKVGDTVTITVTEADDVSGLAASNATFNGEQVPLMDQGNGTYVGHYTVQPGDDDAVNAEATNITLTGPGGTSSSASSTGSSLKIDGSVPAVDALTVNPNSGTVSPGEALTITAHASSNESGLTSSSAYIAGTHVALSDMGGGLYQGTYYVKENDHGAPFGDTPIFTDDLETGVLDQWDTAEAGIAIGASSRHGDHGVQYTLDSTTMRRLSIDLGSDTPETFSSYYFKISPDFNLANNDIMYLDLMSGDSGNSAWATRLRRINGQYYINVYLGAWVTQVGVDIPINPGEWYWIKVHHNSGVNGALEWWVNGELVGQYAGDTSAAVSRKFSAMYISGMDAGTTGTVYFDHFQVTTTDHSEPMALEASGVTLTDAAGNVSAPASSYGSTLTVSTGDPIQPDTTPPVIASVSISPNSGTVGIGDQVTITVTEAGNEAGLTASNANINGKSISLIGQGNGTYTGVYTVQDGDQQGTNIEATGITLTDGSGNTSAPASSSGSTLAVSTDDPIQPDTTPPVIASVSISPNSGTVGIGEQVTITVTEAGNETGLTASNASINGKSIALAGQGNGTYAGVYTVQNGDQQGTNIEATGITLTDGSGNTSASASSSGSSLSVVYNVPVDPPVIASVTINPSAGYAKIGDQIHITVTEQNAQAGLSASNATINNKQVSLTDQGDGTYTGTYVVINGDNDTSNVEATGIILTGANGSSPAGSSSGSTLKVDAHAPAIQSVVIYPKTGTVSAGDNVSITVTASNSETGLIPSSALINGKSVSLSDLGGGAYRGTYTVLSNDNAGVNIEATNITLTDAAGNVSGTASSSGSTLSVSTGDPVVVLTPPVISSVSLSPNSGYAKIGDSVSITVLEQDNQIGLSASYATINNKQVPLSDKRDGTYVGTYTVSEGDNNGVNIEATNIKLIGPGGVSAIASSSGSTLKVDADRPVISSIQLIPETGIVVPGDSIHVTVTAANNETGLVPSPVMINGKEVLLADSGSGVYDGYCVIEPGDSSSVSVEVTGVTLTDVSGNVSDAAGFSATSLSINADNPEIALVEILPEHGWVTIGDSVKVTVTAMNNRDGLIPSSAQLNGREIELAQAYVNDEYHQTKLAGVFEGWYVVSPYDEQGKHIEATGVTLSDEWGNASDAVSSTGSTLNVDTNPPKVKSVVLSPMVEKVAGLGQSINIVATAEMNEAGLIPSEALINDHLIELQDFGDGTYRGTYVISSTDNRATNVEATGIILTDLAGNKSQPASSQGSNLTIIPVEKPEITRSDFNNDGAVTFLDFTLFATTFGRSKNEPNFNAFCDLDDDGRIGLVDFSIFAANYNQPVSASKVSSEVQAVAKFANTSALYTSGEHVYSLGVTMNEDKSECITHISISNYDMLTGMQFTLNYNSSSLSLDVDSINDIPGLVIPDYGEGRVNVSAMFMDEPFTGDIVLKFTVLDANEATGILLSDAQAATQFGVYKIPENGAPIEVAKAINDLTLSRVSESVVALKWTAPDTGANRAAAYFVEVLESYPGYDVPLNPENKQLDIVPQPSGAQETVQLNSLKPGTPYRFAIRFADGTGIMSGSSNELFTQTFAKFVDNDLDPSDPYIQRDDDSLFVSDNDNVISFTWNSWSVYGAESYSISVLDDQSGEVVLTETTHEASYEFTGQSGVTYSLRISPMNANGDALGTIETRSILCPESEIAPPGRPDISLND